MSLCEDQSQLSMMLSRFYKLTWTVLTSSVSVANIKVCVSDIKIDFGYYVELVDVEAIITKCSEEFQIPHRFSACLRSLKSFLHSGG